MAIFMNSVFVGGTTVRFMTFEFEVVQLNMSGG